MLRPQTFRFRFLVHGAFSDFDRRRGLVSSVAIGTGHSQRQLDRHIQSCRSSKCCRSRTQPMLLLRRRQRDVALVSCRGLQVDARSRWRCPLPKNKTERWCSTSACFSGALERLMELWNDDVLSFFVWVSSPTRRHCGMLDSSHSQPPRHDSGATLTSMRSGFFHFIVVESSSILLCVLVWSESGRLADTKAVRFFCLLLSTRLWDKKGTVSCTDSCSADQLCCQPICG